MVHDRPPHIPDMSHEITEIPPHNSSEAESRMTPEQKAMAVQIAELLNKLQEETGFKPELLLRVGNDIKAVEIAENSIAHFRKQKAASEALKAAEEADMDAKIAAMETARKAAHQAAKSKESGAQAAA